MSESVTDERPQETHLLSDRYKSAGKHDAIVLNLSNFAKCVSVQIQAIISNTSNEWDIVTQIPLS